MNRSSENATTNAMAAKKTHTDDWAEQETSCVLVLMRHAQRCSAAGHSQ